MVVHGCAGEGAAMTPRQGAPSVVHGSWTIHTRLLALARDPEIPRWCSWSGTGSAGGMCSQRLARRGPCWSSAGWRVTCFSRRLPDDFPHINRSGV